MLLNQKEEEISELRRKMDDMAEEFGEMLRVRSSTYTLCYIG